MRIYLRPVTVDDASNIVKWRNSPSVMNHSFNKTPITIESNIAFYKANVETGKYKRFIVERIEEDFGVSSYPIATVYLKDLDMVNRRCELCIFTSDDEEWNTESQSIAIRMLLKKAFCGYQMHKVYTYVFSKNEDEISLMKSAGLKIEALLKEEALDINGNYIDAVRMSIFSDEYEEGRTNE